MVGQGGVSFNEQYCYLASCYPQRQLQEKNGYTLSVGEVLILSSVLELVSF
jgi:hypothetical protein